MSAINELYQAVILDHGRTPRNFGPLKEATHTGLGHNPLCGDELTLYLIVEEDHIQLAQFIGHGCAISMASSSLMTESLRGKSVAEAEQLFKIFHRLVTEGKVAEDEGQLLGKLEVLKGVSEFPSRVKCATLAWQTLANILF